MDVGKAADCDSNLSTYDFDITTAEYHTSHITLRGYKVIGGGYTGSLLCTGLTHWRVADLTSRYICSRSKLFQNKSVLELGCGLGLCGIVAAHVVGLNGRVLLTDGDFEVLEIARSNIKENNVQNIAQTLLLKWNDSSTADSILDEYSKNSSSGRGFDIIVGSDCLYCGMEAVQQLFSVVSLMLAKNADVVNDETIELNEDVNNKCANDDSEDDGDDDDDLKPTSIDGGGWKLIDSGPDNSIAHVSSDTNPDSVLNVPNSDDPVIYSTKPSERNGRMVIQPVFILGYERRLGGANVDMSAMFQIAGDLGLEWCIAEDSVVDIFGNETSEQTLLWEQCVFLFTRKRTSVVGGN